MQDAVIGLSRYVAFWPLLPALAISSIASAQTIPDTTLGSETSIVQPGVSFNGTLGELITGGASRGSNLFHSFEAFNVAQGQAVYFANPVGIETILGRVTGSTLSGIDGLLGVDGTANLFLLNPNGFVFGPNAQLDVRGSFGATTASGVAFADGMTFAAGPAGGGELLSVNVPSGLQLGAARQGTIASQANLQAGQDLVLNAMNLDLQDQLIAERDLSLAASDKLRIRDSDASPFLAAAGRNALFQGNQSVDIFALSHPQSSLFSGGDMLLRSAGTVAGDAHYSTGGSFRIEQLDGAVGNLYSPEDPVILSGGDVTLGDYEGASLHILAGGSVTLGAVTITGADTDENAIHPGNTTVINEGGTTLGDLAMVTMVSPVDPSVSQTVTVEGNERATLDVRAGIDWSQLGGVPTPELVNPSALPVELGSSPERADIVVNGDIRVLNDEFIPVVDPDIAGELIREDVGIVGLEVNPSTMVLLTNQYFPNDLPGEILTQGIDTSTLSSMGRAENFTVPFNGEQRFFRIILARAEREGGDIFIDAREDFSTNQKTLGTSVEGIGAYSRSKTAGQVSIYSGGSVDVGNIQSFVHSNYVVSDVGNGGNITVHAFDDMSALVLASWTHAPFGASESGGRIDLNSGGNINVSGIMSHSVSRSILLENGAVIAFEGKRSGNGGDISLVAQNNIKSGPLFSYSVANTTSSQDGIGSGDAGNGGSIRLLSEDGSVDIAGLFSYSYASVYENNRSVANRELIDFKGVAQSSNGGDIVVESKDNINIGDIGSLTGRQSG